ncbi:DUF6114 domain-containing protein [Corynebacterium dentalis]|uniref:DUF6114 domain-containing protein n=1 Tax=Corynebacterium dentalis TaxID=2014528 RepID=UPI0028973F33|nr:DUF6114 domain-containing protein [Corynebacterium dentalis]
MKIVPANQPEFTDNEQAVVEDSPRNRRFKSWRKRRPFGAGLAMILSGLVMLAPAYLSFKVSNIQVQISTLSGVSTALLGILLITCGISTWTRKEGRILTGVAAMVLGIVALPAANFGGFVLGTMLALIGGAMSLSWDPEERLSRKERKRLRENGHDDKLTDESADEEPEEFAEADEAEVASDEEFDDNQTTEIPTVNDQESAAKAPKGSSFFKRGGRGGATTVIAVLTALAVGTGTHMSNAQAQLPNLQLPGIDDVLPNQNDQQQNPDQLNENPLTQNPAPSAPTVPQLPELPKLPEAPRLPAPNPNAEVDLPEEFSGLALPQIGGLDTAPPEPIPGMLLPNGKTYTVQSDKTTLLGNVKMSYVSIETAQGTKPAIRIDADRVILDNLRVRFPGDHAIGVDIWQRSGPGKISTLNGNFHIIVASLNVTPQLAGVALPFALPISADDVPENIGKELKKVGAGLPDAVSSQTVMLNGTMETYYISADDLVGAPGTTIAP